MKIEVYNTCIKIIDFKMEENHDLLKYLSVWDRNTFSYSWCAFYYDEDKQILTVPKINPYFVQNKLGKDIPIFNYETDEGGRKAVMKLQVKPRNNIQADAIEFLLNDPNPRKLLCLKPGEGKTYCAINYLTHVKKRSLIIVDQDRISTQWKESFLKFTDIHESEIHIIAGADSIKKITREKKGLPYKVFIASHRTLATFMAENPNKFTDFVDKMGIGVKIIDEAHVEVKNTVLIDGFSNVPTTIYLTATPKRSNPQEDILFQKIFKYTSKFDSTSSRQSKYHKVALVSFNSEPTAKEEAMCSTKRGFDLNAYGRYLFESKFDLISNVIDKIVDLTMKKNGKLAIVIHNLEHITMMKNHLEERINPEDIGLFCGLTKGKDKNAQLDKKIILTTEKQFNKAVDVENLRFLIMTVPTSSEVIAEQLLGRLRKLPDNRDVLYFDLTDEGFKACKSQRTKRKKIFKNFATKFLNLKL